jgi:hypothetical protein
MLSRFITLKIRAHNSAFFVIISINLLASHKLSLLNLYIVYFLVLSEQLLHYILFTI